MNRVLVHLAIPSARLSVAKSAAGLSGQDGEFSVPLKSLSGKPAAIWDGVKGYPQGFWLGASQHLEVGIAQALFADSDAKKTEAFFVAYIENGDGTYTQAQTNCPAWPADESFAAFLTLIGCEIDATQQGNN